MERDSVRIASIVCLCTVVGLVFSGIPVFGATVRPKSEMISNFKNLCDAYRGVASYESLGKSLLGQDIWIFRFGNPNGARVMWDAEVHGSEDMGAEIAWIFVNWLLKSNDARAKTYLQKNWLLIVPVINIDTTARANMRRSYVLSNGTTIQVPYGVNLNRNFPAGWGTFGSSNPLSTSDYRGLYGGSEPETRVMINAFRKYKPVVHVNTHMWAYPLTAFYGDKAVVNAIIASQANYFNTVHPTYSGNALTPYTISYSGLAGGTVPRQSYDMGMGTTSGIIELNPAGPDQFSSTKYGVTPLWAIQQYYYPKALGYFQGTLDAVQQNPALGSLDYDATLNSKPISSRTTYSITYPDGTIKTFYRTGSVLYNLAQGVYSIKATINGETQQSSFSIFAGKQTKVVLQFGVKPTFFDGFEGASQSYWVISENNNETVILNSVERAESGSYSAKFSVDNLENSGEFAYIQRQVSPMTEFYVQAYVEFSSLPLSGSWCPINIRAGLGTPGALAWLEASRESTGVVWAVNWRDSTSGGTRTSAIYGVAVNANQWYRIEMYVKVDTPTTGEVGLWINGNLVFRKTGINNAEWSTGAQYIQFGERWSSPLSGAHSVYIDAVEVSSNYIP